MPSVLVSTPFFSLPDALLANCPLHIHRISSYHFQVSFLSNLFTLFILFTLLASYSDDGPINYKVSCNRRIFNGGSARGVYIREAKECVAPLEINVSITPVFHEDMPQKAKVGFEKFVFLQVFMNDEAEREWVKCPRETLLAAQGRSFNILVDPTRLPAGGGVYTATVRGFDASTADGVAAGGDLSGLPPLFEVPVTVVKPGMAAGAAGAVDMSQYESELEQGGMQCGEHVFTAGERWRHFVSVPNGATWCDVIVEGIETNAEASASASKGDGENTSKTPLMMVLHCLQLHPHLPYRDHELKNYMRLAPGSTEVFTYKVTSGVTMEVCLSQFWSQLGACGAKMRVVFHSLSPDRGAVTLHGGDHVEKVVVTSHIRPEMLEPKVKCSKWQQKLRPKESVIVPLTDRDVWLNNRQVEEKIGLNMNRNMNILNVYPLINQVIVIVIDIFNPSYPIRHTYSLLQDLSTHAHVRVQADGGGRRCASLPRRERTPVRLAFRSPAADGV